MELEYIFNIFELHIIWIIEKNDAKKFREGAMIKFVAYVASYQKNGGRFGIGLGALQNVEINN